MAKPGTSDAQALIHGGPAPARVPGNEWRGLSPPELGRWTPSEPVSLVIPAFQAQPALELTLEAVAEQTYPAHLLQVVVVDDGSDPPIADLTADDTLDVVVVRQEHLGFGGGRARNRGAMASDGAILVFLDADTIPDPVFVEAHSRWHHVVADAATLGSRTHVDVDGLDHSELRRFARNRDLNGLFANREQWRAEWIERFLERTDDLASDRDDLYKVVTGSNLGIRADTFRAIGGMRVLGVRGVEDTQLGYRLACHGSLLVPERMAHGWHQGASHFQGPERTRTHYERIPVMENYIPVGGFRAFRSSRVFAVPAVVIVVSVADEPASDVVKMCDALLGGDFRDVGICLFLSESYDEDRYLEHAFGSEPRVTLGDEPPDWSEAAFRLHWPVEALASSETLAALLQRMKKDSLAAMHVTVPGGDSGAPRVEMWRSGPMRRAMRIATSDGGDWEAILGELFSEAWVSGYDVGLTRNWRKFCPLCEQECDSFLPHGDPPRPEARCPSCNSLERHRLAWSYMSRETTIQGGGEKRMLLLARETSLATRLSAVAGLTVTTVAGGGPAVIDVAQEDDAFDAVYGGGLRAGDRESGQRFQDVYRVLRPGGWALFLGRPGTAEPKTGEDLDTRLQAAGFAVKSLVYAERLGRAWSERLGIDRRTRVHYCQKPER